MATTQLDPAPRAVDRARAVPGALARPILGNPVMAWLGPLLVAGFAFALRVYRLSVPAKTAFDEVYYSCDAQMLLRYGYEHAHMKDNVCVVDVTTPGPGYVVHPPLGKWLIAIGEAIFGWDSNGGARAAFGWRISACVAGAVSVFVLCRLGRRLFRSTLLGCFAGGLLALDGLHFVQSRMAMLDIFLMLFVVCAAACLVADRDWFRGRLDRTLAEDRSYPGPWLFWRPWRLMTGVMLGCAIGVKWSGIYYVAAFMPLALFWDSRARRAAGVPRPFRAALWRDLAPVVAFLFVVTAVAYLGTWSGWFLTHDGWRRTCGTGAGQFAKDCGPIRGFIAYHREVYKFHTHLHSPHPYASKPWGWLVLARPVLYVFEQKVKGHTAAVVALGTPAIWWGSILALIGCVWGWLSRRDWRAVFILVAFAAGYLPWFWPSDRTEFFFYALPAVPFLCLALAYCAGLAIGGPDASPERRQLGASVVAVYALLVVVNFFYLYPVISAQLVPTDAWRARMWFSSWI